MNILITGGRSDMAQEMVKIYLELGHTLFVSASSDDGKSELEKLYKEKGLQVTCFKFDFSDPNDSNDELDKFLALGIDGLILNAWNSVKDLKMFHEVTDDDISIELDLNVKANVWLLRKILPHMKDKNFGRILFISSLVTVTGASLYGPYCLAKCAMEGLILNLAVDYGSYNILSNTIRPGIIKTERTRRFWEREYYEKRMSKPIPQKRLGNAIDVAKATIPFMDEVSYINGTALNVSGGLPLISTKGNMS